ncbi:DEAD/DEAH box helicase [Gracilibacillus halophilus YIM-C55.5]|uniref:DEAD/DEAH box helicase n=1 Tax=Gracilibacillus halophilus YIM-C55.5 TaxID=1308866 RepID=N4WP75_9BACI|nr:hypothetical protein [Gracilibacillus halophilus]ENH97927.1 DEAD/DEAH box helicase [Gracilibacillus halophilus YIM-C55.5]
MEIRLRDVQFNSWLLTSRTENKGKKYRHLKLNEELTFRDEIVPSLKNMVEEAHQDYKNSKRSLLLKTLDPSVEDIESLGKMDPAYGYPDQLDLTTLKGTFGEVFAGIIAENFAPFNVENWKVPVFSFRHHEAAFDQLETYKRTGDKKNATMGRPGDDCLAFELDQSETNIRKILFCEAKCTNDHSSSLVKKAHEQLSDSNIIPVETLRLIEILNDYDTDYAIRWSEALRNLYLDLGNFGNSNRYDLVSYVCGNSPKKKSTWIDTEEPHEGYSAGRELESVEVHISDIDQLVKTIYQKEEDSYGE